MTVNLSTSYLGLPLRSPLVVGAAAPLSGDGALLQHLEEAGAAAIVLHSLFLEQVERDWQEWEHHQRHGSNSYGEALSYVPATPPSQLGLNGYLAEIRAAKRLVAIPVLASLNGVHPGHWLDAALAVADAGASAIELNLYTVPSDGRCSGAELEAEQLALVREICQAVALPVAVKLSPWYTSLAAMARGLEEAGAAGLVLFNRFYQPTIDIETLDTICQVELSGASDQRLPLRWIGLLHGRHGPGHLQRMQGELCQWLEEHGYDQLDGLRGCLSQGRCPDPEAFERAQYQRALSGYCLPKA